MRTRILIAGAGIVLIMLSTGCRKDWDAHYTDHPVTTDRNLWEDLQAEENLSLFVQAMKDLQYDTLFNKDDTYTLFIPGNESLSAFLDTAEMTNTMLDYHISKHFIISDASTQSKAIQTLGEKFVRFERYKNLTTFDGIPLEFESPLYLNGKYYVLSELAFPRPNLYEYIAANNPVLKSFILSQDSIIIDKEKSIPIGFDGFGNTIYDTVAVVYNEFEELYFPVREEFRSKTATLVFPKEEDYNNALDEMAQSIVGYTDHNDIPLDWQNEILIPYLLDRGVFRNSLEPLKFIFTGPPTDTLKLKNILGDSVYIEYEVSEKSICSNGYAYNYKFFQIPDTLSKGSTRFEGEWLLEKKGANKFAWWPEVNVQSDVSFAPRQEFSSSSSNDSILYVPFTKSYKGAYSLEFRIDNLFPRKYLMVIRTSTSIGGIFNIYFNDVLVKTIDTYDLSPWNYSSVISGKYYKPKNGFNRYDCWVQNDNDYGNSWLRFEYVGPGYITSQGLIFDYIDFMPYE